MLTTTITPIGHGLVQVTVSGPTSDYRKASRAFGAVARQLTAEHGVRALRISSGGTWDGPGGRFEDQAVYSVDASRRTTV